MTEDELRVWVAEACEELADIRTQWGDDYIWRKQNERFVLDLFERAGYEG